MKATFPILKSVVGAFLCAACGTCVAVEGRVFFENACPVANEANQAKETAPIVTALAGKIVGAVTGATIDALANKLSEEQQVTVTFYERKTNWYRQSAAAGGQPSKFVMDSGLVCLIVVVGENLQVRRGAADPGDYEQNWATPPTSSANEFSRMKRANENLALLGIMAPPAFYMEYRVTVLDGGNAFALDPRFVYYPNFMGKKVWLGPDTRDLLVQFEFAEPGSETPFAESKLQFNGLEVGALTTQRIQAMRTPWSKQPSTGNSASSDSRLVPFNIKVLFTETAKPGRLGAILAGVLNEQKASLVSAAETRAKLALSESERQSTRSTAQDSANTALTNYVAAYDEYEAALKAQEEATASGDSKALTKAKNRVGLARIKLDNALSIARSAFDAADIPFTPIS